MPTAAPVDLVGALAPTRARVAGDVRANENIALTAIQTLFARDHNRIVEGLANSLPADQKFDVARRIVAPSSRTSPTPGSFLRSE